MRNCLIGCVVLLAMTGTACNKAPKSAEPGKAPQEEPPKELAVDLGGGVKMEMVLIPAGSFLMGDDVEKPVHKVRITKPFYLGKYEVTQEQWEAVMGSNPSYFKGPKNPVETVSWDDCQKFLVKLNAKTGGQGGKFVLPTEAQWEYACRAGSTSKFCFGDDENQLGEYAWYRKNSGSKTHPVGEKKPNTFGLYDMHGNAFEWCADWYDSDYYGKSPADDPSGPATGLSRVIRGGGRDFGGRACQSACRISREPWDRGSYRGLRVARVPADAVAETRLPESLAQENGSAKAPPLAVAPFTAAAARQHQETWVKHIGQPREATNSIGMKLTLIPAGEFKMGSGESAEDTAAFFNKTYGEDLLKAGLFKNEHPQHRVRITKPFYLGTYHVTRGQFRVFAAASGYKTDAEKGEKPGAYGWNPDTMESGFNEKYSWRNAGFEQTNEHPVVCVSWNDAVAFCAWLSKKEGKTYRLPTEAEWEYACRAGTTTRYYSGDDPETLAKVGNVVDATVKAKFPEWSWTIKASDGYVFTAPVGKFKPNAFGLYDMHGNAWQRCADWYGAEYYAASPADDPTGPDSGNDRVLRGGSWIDRPLDTRSANRVRSAPDLRSSVTGFRVARTP